MKPLNYQSAGVDIVAGDLLVEKIGPLAKSTLGPQVLAGVGGFGALFALDLKQFPEPVLVSGTDGVGTKVLIAHALDRLDTVGIDLVAMSVNDILTLGAKPLFFLDYLAMGKLDVERGVALVKGIVEGCKQSSCSLIGGETAEMPGVYNGNEFDLAGFAVGVVNRPDIIDGKSIKPGDVAIGLASSGLHSNGYSLARKICLGSIDKLGEEHRSMLHSQWPLLQKMAPHKSLGDVLLTPTRIYVKAVMELQKQVRIKGLAHITGGGLPGNLPRILSETLAFRIRASAWKRPALFAALQEAGHVTDEEMFSTFNMGIGFVIVVNHEEADRAMEILQHSGETAYVIGEVTARKAGDPDVAIVA